MCWGDPAKSLELARARLTPEQWNRFEREFNDFCVVQGLFSYRPETSDASINAHQKQAYNWARWAFFQGREWGIHHSDCATHNEPAYQNGPCDCGVDQRIADAKYTHLALAMMDDEQAVASLERWRQR